MNLEHELLMNSLAVLFVVACHPYTCYVSLIIQIDDPLNFHFCCFQAIQNFRIAYYNIHAHAV